MKELIAFFATVYNLFKTSDKAAPPSPSADSVSVVAPVSDPSTPIHPCHFSSRLNDQQRAHREKMCRHLHQTILSQSSTPIRKFPSRLLDQERAHRGFSDIYRNRVKTSDEAPPPSPSVSVVVDPVSDPSTSIRPRQSSSFLHYGLTDEQGAGRLFNDILINPLKTSDGALPPPSPSADSVTVVVDPVYDQTTLVRPRQDSSCLQKSADRVFIIDVLYNRVQISDEAPPYSSSPLADSVSAVIVAVSDPSNPELNNGDQVHPVIKAMQEQELGKAIIALPVAIVVGVGVAGYYILGDGWVVWLIETLACLGTIFILFGMLWQEGSPTYAPIAQLLGILLSATAVFGVVALFLPFGLIWVPGLGIVSCVLTFAIVVGYHPSTYLIPLQVQGDGGGGGGGVVVES